MPKRRDPQSGNRPTEFLISLILLRAFKVFKLQRNSVVALYEHNFAIGLGKGMLQFETHY